MKKHECNLATCLMCSCSISDWLPAIAAQKKNIEIKKGQQIFTEGDEATHIYFVYSGKVKVHKRWDDEKEIIIRFAKPGDILGHMGLGSDPVYPVSTTAIEPTVICAIGIPFFESTLKVNPEFTYTLMKLFANELQESEKRMRNLVHMPVKERIALALLNLKKQFGVDDHGAINIELTRQDLSSFAAVSYETLFKVSNELLSHGLIEVNGKSVKILDEKTLTALTANRNKA